jgi:O-acetyl-ADP-ribose deacetylase (regulator of RNase III)
MEIIKGNIFTSECQTLVNTINCVGVMGAGIALEMRLRYPEMFRQYVQLCELSEIEIGKLWLYKVNQNQMILNFPTKKHWKYPSKFDYIESGLKRFLEFYTDNNISSIAFPLLGTSHGGLNNEAVLDLMEKYLSLCDIPVEVYIHDSKSQDEVIISFVDLLNKNVNVFKEIGIKKSTLSIIDEAIQTSSINSIIQLLSIKGISEKTIEKLFNFLIERKNSPRPYQEGMFL